MEGTFFSLGTDSAAMVLHCYDGVCVCAMVFLGRALMLLPFSLVGTTTSNDFGGAMATLPSAETQHALRCQELCFRQQTLLVPLNCAGQVGHEAGL